MAGVPHERHPDSATGPKAQRVALEAMRKALDEGRTVGLFPEAQLCRSGMMTPFLRGVEMILRTNRVSSWCRSAWPVSGSYFSFSGGHFFGKRPKACAGKSASRSVNRCLRRSNRSI